MYKLKGKVRISYSKNDGLFSRLGRPGMALAFKARL